MKKSFNRLSRLVLSVLFLSVLILTGCQREIHDPNGNTNPPPPTPPGNGSAVNDNVKVVASVRGIVVDENDRPVAGAAVASGIYTTTTDRYGTFRFNSINLSKANGYVKVTKSGYFTGSRTFITTAGRTHNVRIKLLPKTNTGNFNASTGGTINMTSGGKLVIPANAVSSASGAYSGTVNVAMTWIDPTSNDLPNIVPGDLRGITTSGEERGLQTFGMLGVELTSNTGQALNMAPGKTAELTFPIPASLLGNAPATIDLWHFDEATGRWKQEGTATKTGSNYIAQVSHFSFWNCDAPFPLVNLCMTLVNVVESIPLNNVQVSITRPNGSSACGRTDSAGNLCGKVPKDEPLVLKVLGQCNNVVYTQNIGPFSSDASLGTITITLPAANTLIITGTLVNCSNANVTNGAAIIYTGNGNSYSTPVSNGAFSITLLRCDNGIVNFSVLGVDYATLQQGSPVSGSGTSGMVNVGTTQACGASSAQFIEFIIDGNPFSYASPPDNVFSNDSLLSGGNIVSVIGIKNTGSNANYSSFNFSSNGSLGVHPLNYCRVAAGTMGIAETILTTNPTINITTFGAPVSGFVEGNFNVQMSFGGTPKTVICTFRARRG